MEKTPYFTRTIVVPGYGWKVKIYEATLQEMEDLQEAIKSDSDGFAGMIADYISYWDCVDKKNNPLPVSAEGLKKLPQSALRFIIEQVKDPFSDDDPKNASIQSPISGQKLEKPTPSVPAPTS